jgi:hypothetical protein
MLVTLGGASGSRTLAEGLADQAHSLRTVPANAAFYWANLRLKEQLDLFLDSNAYRRLMEIPILQIGKGQLEFHWRQSPQPIIARFREFFNSAEGQETLALIKEMHSEEIFFYGGDDVVHLLRLLMELNGVNRTAKLEALASGEEESEVLSRNVIELLDEHADQFNVPDIVLGYRIEDAERATRHLDRIQEVLSRLLREKQPELEEHLKREQIAGNEFVTMRLDGSMIPWDQIREQAEEVDEEQFAEWQQLLAKKTVAVALGVVGEFVLLSIGDTLEPLESIGSGPSLSSQPALARLARHADQPVTSVAYVSQSLAESLSSPQRTIDDLVGAAEQALEKLEVAEDQSEQLMKDVREFGQDMLKYMPEPGALAAISYLTARGYESYQYQSGTRPMVDSSKPLSVLEHVGGNPLMLLASRSKFSASDYDQVISWLKRLAGQVEQIAEDKADPDDWDRYSELKEKGLPLLERLDRANREQLLPALAAGEQALVLDASAVSNQWFELQPESPQPLPMLEIGVVANVSDAEKLRKGVEEYFGVLQEAIALFHEMNPENVPDFQVPEPQIREMGEEGILYYYPLPAEAGVDEQITPNGGVTKSVAAASLTPAFTERLLRTKPLALDSSLDMTRPASTAFYLEFAKFAEAVRPWVDYGGAIATGQVKLEDEEEEEFEGEEGEDVEQGQEQAGAMMVAGIVLPQIHQFLDVAAAVRSASSVTYQEDGAWVTHGEVHIQDLE